MKNFRYLQPESLNEALQILHEHAGDAKVLAGGQSLLILMREGLVQPEIVVGLSRLSGMNGIELDAAARMVTIGALATHRQIELSPLIRAHLPLLAEAYRNLGSVQVRNLGTLGGNLCHNAPGSDPPTALVALGARVTVQRRDPGDSSASSKRGLPLEEFGSYYYETVLAEDELLTVVHIPLPPAHAGSAYHKIAPRPSDIPFVGAAALVVLEADGRTCADVRIALGGVAPTTVRSRSAESTLLGQELSDALIAGAGDAAVADTDPISDTNASAQYRRDLVPIAVRRVVTLARQRALA
jgi:carbon-monoxide dehydrogenase medium subunit